MSLSRGLDPPIPCKEASGGPPRARGEQRFLEGLCGAPQGSALTWAPADASGLGEPASRAPCAPLSSRPCGGGGSWEMRPTQPGWLRPTAPWMWAPPCGQHGCCRPLGISASKLLPRPQVRLCQGLPLRSPSLSRDVTVAPSRSPRCLIAQLRRGSPQPGELPAWLGRVCWAGQLSGQLWPRFTCLARGTIVELLGLVELQ